VRSTAGSWPHARGAIQFDFDRFPVECCDVRQRRCPASRTVENQSATEISVGQVSDIVRVCGADMLHHFSE
jgi:hypothetical protein